MMSLFSKIINREDVRSLMDEVINRECYNKLTVSFPLANNYFIDQHYALFLLMDAFGKFDIIIGDYNYFDEYLRYLKRTFKKMNTYQDISKGINLAISKIVSRILNINNSKSNESKEKILRYVYKKYIVDGYFYYGLSSSEKREVSFSGIKKDGVILDSRLSEVNNILKKYEDKDIIKRVVSNLTDNFMIACYYSFLGPVYLEELAVSGIFKDKCYNSNCFYTKDVRTFKDNLEKYISNKRMNSEERALVINNLLDVWKENNVSSSHGCIAFIKRSSINRNYLKDIEEIISNSCDMDLNEAMAMILESRYGSYDIDSDILTSDFELLDIPSYRFIINDCSIDDNMDTSALKIDYVDDSGSNNFVQKVSLSHGYISVFMLAGVLLISVGVILTFVVGNLGG